MSGNKERIGDHPADLRIPVIESDIAAANRRRDDFDQDIVRSRLWFRQVLIRKSGPEVSFDNRLHHAVLTHRITRTDSV